MSYKSMGEDVGGGWAQMAECIANGGAWTGTSCDYSGQVDIMAKEMCEGAGGIWDPVAKTCGIIGGAPPPTTIPGTTPPTTTPPLTPPSVTPPVAPPPPPTTGPPTTTPPAAKAEIFGLPPLAVGLGAAALGVVLVGALAKKKKR
ncbi:MAG: hypothetical protein JRD89_02520 [Deltaproteobacteria bacterium]|nr:hypothetical protein [Deltaproteobacteria bacterium]